MKGPALAMAWRQAFGADLRTYTDADILVAKCNIDEAAQVLTRDLGGVGGGSSSGEKPFVMPSGIVVDLHWQPINDPWAMTRHRLDTDAVLSRVDRSGELPILDPVDGLLHTCVHAVISDAGRLSAAIDVACLTRTNRYAADRLIAVAQSHQAVLALAVMVDRAAKVTSWPEAQELARELPRSAWRRVCIVAAPTARPAAGPGHSGSEVFRATRTNAWTSVLAAARSIPNNLRVQRALRAAATPSLDRKRVALISLEPWDEMWRRNQHLASELTKQQLVESIVFVEPPVLWRGASRPRHPIPGVTVVRPSLRVPRRLGGLRSSAIWLRRHWLKDIDVLWINDPELGALCLRRGRPSVYDVTDDWRHSSKTPRLAARLVAAEDRLARKARTIVCSAELGRRWRQRYAVNATVVQNAAARSSYVGCGPAVVLPGGPPYGGYVGTLHEDRLDIGLCLALARSHGVGSLHLVGPNLLSKESLSRLAQEPAVVLHPAIAADDVPRWLMSFDVLLSPHVVTDFTRSLDAIKAFEYLATDKPVVATPTSGFQTEDAPGLVVSPASGFCAAVLRAVSDGDRYSRSSPTWADRAPEFASAARLSGHDSAPQGRQAFGVWVGRFLGLSRDRRRGFDRRAKATQTQRIRYDSERS
jgi:glycosyltransferase involved in cell wall biosynthesis